MPLRFETGGWTCRAGWLISKDLRKANKNISVKVENLKTSSEGQKATATFIQKYSASNIKSNRPKRLELVKINGEWKIIRESVGH
jgi:hypothetical protein